MGAVVVHYTIAEQAMTDILSYYKLQVFIGSHGTHKSSKS